MKVLFYFRRTKRNIRTNVPYDVTDAVVADCESRDRACDFWDGYRELQHEPVQLVSWLPQNGRINW